MGKRIIAQRRGAGTRRFVAPSHRYFAKIKHKVNITKDIYYGKVVDLLHSVSHSAPLALVEYDDGEKCYIAAPEGISVGDMIAFGKGAGIKTGNTLPLSNIPEGSLIYNIEGREGDGGKYIRASGTFGKVVSKTGDKVVVLMPSKVEKIFNDSCKATIGAVAGGGRLEKPFIKAGKRWHAMRARGRLYPITSPVSMNAMEHPFGSGRGSHMGKSSVPPRFAPPGRKVGQIKARRTGRRR